MSEFIRALGDLPFLRQALLAGLAASVTAGVVGSLVVTRRMAAAAGGLAHAVLGGMGLAYWLNATQGMTALHPMHGALAAAVACALILAWVRAHGRERDDTAISVLWAVGMAVGVLFLSQTPGYRSDLMGYLLGNILLVDPVALRWLLGLDTLAILVLWFFHNQIIATSFDPEFARLRGLNVEFWETVILLLVAVTVVSLVYVVGIVMVIALLTIPAATVGRFTSRMATMMVGAVILCAVITTAGLGLSYHLDLPTGAVDVVLASAIYLLALLLDRPALRRRLRGGS